MGNAILKGQTGGASPTVISQKKLTLLADVTIYSARTSVDFTGLNVGADTELLLVSDVVNSSGTNGDMYIYVNGNTTLTNYYRQGLYANSTTVNANRQNTPAFMYVSNGTKQFGNLQIKMTNNGYFVYQTADIESYGSSSIINANIFGTSTFTISSITSLTLTSANSNGISIGSRFQLYSLNTGGEKTWVTS